MVLPYSWWPCTTLLGIQSTVTWPWPPCEASGAFSTPQTPPRNGKIARDVGIGGATGLGSIIYALVSAGRLLRDAELLEDAGRAAHLLTPELIARDRQLDVMGGAAGAILGLLALANATGEEAVIARAAACASIC